MDNALAPAHEYRTMIHEGHLDTFGHVNNATYLELMEEARWAWITDGGYGLDVVVERRQGPTILECNVKFQRELRNRQPIVIRTWVESYVGKVARVWQQVLLDGGQSSCIASFTLALFDLDRRKLIDPTQSWLVGMGLPPDVWQPRKST